MVLGRGGHVSDEREHETADLSETSFLDELFREISPGLTPDPVTETGGITRATVKEALEATSQPATKKSKSKRVAYSVACTLRLSGSDYQVQLLPESSDYDKAYRLNKLNAQKPTGYNVTQVDGEIICECHDFRFRQDGADTKGCKHIRGLVDMGMFSAPSVPERRSSGVFDG